MKALEDKVAVITGGNSGIGLATALRFREEGAKVVVFGRSQESLDQASQQLGGESLAIQGDVTSKSDLERLFKETVSRFGKIDVLVANAGVAQVAPLSEVDEEHFDFVSNINFKGLFFTVQRSLDYLNVGASIVLTASVVNRKGFPGFGVYAATKAAVRSLARTWAVELAPMGIRVNVLSPGPIQTPIYERMELADEVMDEFSSSLSAQVPLGRFGQSGEIANAALFLASSQSSYVNGSELSADGGFAQI